MTEYITTSFEHYLLGLPYDTKQLKNLQKSTVSCIQIVSYRGTKAIKSVEDIYRKVRIVAVSLLTKIYEEYSEHNA